MDMLGKGKSNRELNCNREKSRSFLTFLGHIVCCDIETMMPANNQIYGVWSEMVATVTGERRVFSAVNTSHMFRKPVLKEQNFSLYSMHLLCPKTACVIERT